MSHELRVNQGQAPFSQNHDLTKGKQIQPLDVKHERTMFNHHSLPVLYTIIHLVCLSVEYLGVTALNMHILRWL